MSVRQLNIHGVRNIREAKLILHPNFNVFYGDNGSGKTSLLESVYLLSAGYSFKTRETLPLVCYGESDLTVFARLCHDETISLKKNISGPTQVKLNMQTCHNNSVLARYLPCQIFYQDIFQVIDAGPAVRRGLLDWGMFHVKHEYHLLWRNYRQVLKQRNALLRQNPGRSEMLLWDSQLVSLSNQLDQLRQTYFQDWAASFQTFLSRLSHDITCTLDYYRGWRSKENSLAAVLEEQFLADKQRQYTQSGAHQADIRIETPYSSAKQGFSRGQQKLIAIALKLAQGTLLKKNCMYLFDDFTAELDQENISRLLNCLTQVPGQKMMTVLDIQAIRPLLGQIDAEFFYLNEGSITPCTKAFA